MVAVICKTVDVKYLQHFLYDVFLLVNWCFTLHMLVSKFCSVLMKDEKGEQTFLILIKVSILEYVVSYYLCC